MHVVTHRMALLALVLFEVSSLSALAEPPTYDGSLALYGAGSYHQLFASPLNPQNQIAQLPMRIENFEARPIGKLFWGSTKLTLRPRLMAEIDTTEMAANTFHHSTALLRWTEASLHSTFGDDWTASYGLQNAQWGPAEANSPSNRVFHDTIQQKDMLYETMGRHLLQLSFTPLQSWNEVLLAEITRNSEDELEYGESFERKVLLKSEISWSGNSQYFGLVLGWRQAQKGWIGEYFTVQLLDGLTFYFDGGQQQGNRNFYPVVDPQKNAIVFTQNRKNQGPLLWNHTLGLRYEFVRGDDLHFEWIHQDAAYTAAENANAFLALTSRLLNQVQFLAYNAPRFKQNGLELPGKNLLYASLRMPNFLEVKDWNIYARVLHSLQDSSRTYFASSENALGTHGTILSSLSTASGAVDSELKGLISVAAFLGYRHAF